MRVEILSAMFLISDYTSTTGYVIIGVGAQSTWGEGVGGRRKTFLHENMCMKNLKKMSEFYMPFARKNNKIPEFYMIFASKRPEFYMIILEKYFPEFWEVTCPPRLPRCPPYPTPMNVGLIVYNETDECKPFLHF